MFSSEMEQDLSNHSKLLADMFHGLSVQKYCTLAYYFALCNKLNIPDSWAVNGKAGTDWRLHFVPDSILLFEVQMQHHLLDHLQLSISFLATLQL